MTDMLRTIEPKSDQLNADDLLGARTLTITVSRVSILAGDQPVALHYEGDNGKPYKPCKSMRRVIVTVWGPDANLYIGSRMTLYRDDSVLFGGVAVGGIRISHISGIDKDRTIALTASRAVRKPFTVRPLVDELSARLEAGQAAAEAGTAALEAFWKDLTAAERKMIGPGRLEAWKARAATRNGLPPTKWRARGEGNIDVGNDFIDEALATMRPHTDVPACGPVPPEDSPLSSGGLAVEHRQQEDAGTSILPGTPASADPPANMLLDPFDTHTRFDELLSDGRAAATNGTKAFKTWHARLNAQDAEMIKPYVDGLKKVAQQADAFSA